MTTTTPLVTIGLSCFNARDTIERALQSAIAQDWPNTEIIVVDDGSTDGSQEIIRSFAAREPSIHFIQHARNRGLPGALNTMIAKARGEFIVFFDDDDRSRPNRVSAHVNRILEFEDRSGASLILCFATRTIRNFNGAIHIYSGIGYAPPEPHGRAIADYLLGVAKDRRYSWGGVGAGTLAARASVFKTIGPFDEANRRGDSWDYAIRLALSGGYCISVADPVVDTFKTAGTDKGDRAGLEMNLILVKKFRRYLGYKYPTAWLWAHCRFHGDQGHIWRARSYKLLSMVASAPLHLARFDRAH